MANFVIIGAGISGMSAAYELRETLGPDHRITVIGDGDRFSFTPSNPWLAVGWRESADITLPAAEYLAKKKIDFLPRAVTEIRAEEKIVVTQAEQRIGYDYLLICTGPKLAFEEVPGLGPDAGHTQSVCTTAACGKRMGGVPGIPRRSRARSWSARCKAPAASDRPTNSR